MNILRVIASMDPASGGPCQGIRNSIPALEQLGVQSEVVSLDAPDASFIGKDTFPLHPVGPSKGTWAYSAALIPWLIENLPRFDAVIIHGLWLYHGYAVRKALDKLKAESGKLKSEIKLPRCYVMSHGMLDPYFQRDPSRRFKAIRNWFYWKLIEGRVVNQADGILFTCEEELLLARETFRPYTPKGEFNVGYGVPEPPAFNPAMKLAFEEKCHGLNEQPYLLFLSRIHPKKGVDLLIRAYADLAQSHLSGISFHTDHSPRPFPSLVIAGPLDSAYAREMQALAAKLLPPPDSSPTDNRSPITDNRQPAIHFPGMLQGDAKWGAFHGTDAFVLPSHQENFGIAVAEALACGKPVLISKKVNIWREIADGGAGIVATDDLAGARELLENWFALSSADRGVMAAKARTVFKTDFSVAPAAVKMSAVLRGRETVRGAAVLPADSR